jgi:hypothetical protein
MHLKSHFTPARSSIGAKLGFATLFSCGLFPLALLLLTPCNSSAQELGDVIGDEAETVEAEFVLERLERFAGRPLDLNSATAAELAELPWVSPLLAQKIVSLRERLGGFRSLHDFTVIEGVSYELLTTLAPYVTITYKGVPYWIPMEGRVRVLADRTVSTSDDVDFYARFTSRPSEQVEVCYLQEKDDGEQNFTDFQAGYLVVRRRGVLSIVSAGDLSVRFGQGLVLWAPQGYFRGYETVSQAERGASGVRGYRSSTENGALRGAHAQFTRSWFLLDLLFSHSRLDAYLNDDGTVRRLADSGYHREEWELRCKDALKEDMFAFHAQARPRSSVLLEGTYYASRYEPSFSPGDGSSAFYFSGDRVSVGGLGLSFSLAQAELFSEAALMDGGRKALTFGWVCDIKRLEMATVFRSYDRDYYNLRASSFSGEDPWNERGVYLGLRTRLGDSKLNFYVDGVQHPGPSYGESFPTSGYETAASIERNHGNGIKTRVRAKLSRRQMSIADPEDPYARKSITSSRETMHGDVAWNPGRPFSFKLRYSAVRADENEKGSLVSVGLGYAPERLVNIRGRVIYYDTSSYESRIYEWEDELPGRVSLDPLWGDGTRWYVVVGVRNKRLSVSAKFAQDRPEDGGTRSELGLQLDFNL